MGIASSVAVSISLDHEEAGNKYARAGSKITGVAHLQVKKPINVTAFRLIVEGNEECVVQYTVTHTYQENGETKTKSETRYAYNERNIIRMSIPVGVSMSGKTLDVGCYDFPFEFTLPPTIPSSLYAESDGWEEPVHTTGSLPYQMNSPVGGPYVMSAPGVVPPPMNGFGGYGHCNIEYVMRVEGGGGSGRHQRPFYVCSAPFNMDPVPFVSNPETVSVKLCCCFNKGSMTCAANVLNTQVAIGDDIPLKFACQNNSTAEIRGIYAELYETVRWSAGGYSNRQHKLLSKIDLGSFISNHNDLKKVETRGEISQDSNEFVYRKLYEDITSDKNIAHLKVDTNANDTFSGCLISCNHELILEVKTPCCITNPSIHIPLRIGRGEKIGGFESTVKPTKPVEGVVVLSNAPPAEWSNPVSLASPAVPDQNIAIGGYAADRPSSLVSDKKTFEKLLSDMEQSLNDLDIVTSCSNDEEWDMILAALTPKQFGDLISKVDLDHNQSKVASVLAESIKPFTSNHIIAALRTCKEWNRPNIIKKLLPLCEDLSTGADKIKAELTSWEFTLTGKDFSDAMESKRK